MKKLIAGLVVMLLVAVAAVFLVMQNHRTAYSSSQAEEACGSGHQVAAQPSGAVLSGQVKETMDSGGYTYVLLDTEAGEKWVAVPKTVVKVGEQAAFASGMMMKNFKSETLQRTFPEIVFSAGAVGECASSSAEACPGDHDKTASPHGSMPMGMGSMASAGMGSMKSSGKVTVPPLDLKIEKAEGDNAFTVAELFAQAKDLNQRKIAVRGKVVKVSKHIMGKNWIHLQDGSGEPEKGTHDLVLTTQEQPEVGQILVANGTLFADKDFGSGYRYEVIVEETQFQ